MTQELVVWVLVTGLLGLVWVMAVAALKSDRPSRKTQDTVASAESADDERTDIPAAHRTTIAA